MRQLRSGNVTSWLLAPLLCVLAALVVSTRGGMMISNTGLATPIPWAERFVGAMFDFGWWMVLSPFIVFGVRRLATWQARFAVRAAAHVALCISTCTAYFL